MSQERKPGQPGTLYLIPCPIAEDTPVWDVLPAANRAVIDSLAVSYTHLTLPTTPYV